MIVRVGIQVMRKIGHTIWGLLVVAFFSCNTAPPEGKTGYTGLFYPVGKPKKIDSSEVLRVSYDAEQGYLFSVQGNSGTGKPKGDLITGTLTGGSIGNARFTFTRRSDGIYEFRAFGSRLELLRLPEAR